MGTLAPKCASTAGAIGCLLQPLKRACCIKLWTAHKRLGVAALSAPFVMDGLGVFRNLHPQGSSPVKIKAAPGIRLMEQTSLNQQTPSAGSSTSASASAVPFSPCVQTRADFVGNIVTHIWNYAVGLSTVSLHHLALSSRTRFRITMTVLRWRRRNAF